MAADPVDVRARARVADVLAAAAEYRSTHRRDFPPAWYPWQRRFLASSATHTSIMLMASNRSGKTMTGSYATACDVTGRYPEWWDGLRIDHPVVCWALGVDGTQTRDVMQRELLGVEGGDGVWRGGWIHHDEIIAGSVIRSHIQGGVAKVRIRHRSGGESELSFKSYSQSSTGQSTLPMAGSSVDVMQVDEQPPDDVVGQLLTRLLTGRRNRGGIVRWTMTPELGETDLVRQFTGKAMKHQELIGPIAWDECPHLDADAKAALLATYPVHERDMRSKGVPMFGTGKVFSFNEDRDIIEPVDIGLRPWWRVIRAIDIGIDHPTAIAWLAWDPETQDVHVCRIHRASDTAAPIHSAVLDTMWPHAPLVVPHDIDNREPGSGNSVRSYYERAGRAVHTFTNPDGSRYVEPGIMAMQEDMALGRMKVWRGQAQEFVEEMRSFHRDDRGKLVKVHDDAISAVRYGRQMVVRYGVPAGERASPMGVRLRPVVNLSRQGMARRHG